MIDIAERNKQLQVHTKDEILDVDVPKEITDELAKIAGKVDWEDQSQARLYYEGAVAALAKFGRAKANEAGKPAYSGDRFEQSQTAGKNARSIAQFLYRNEWFGNMVPAIGGENQPHCTKILDPSGNDYSLQLYPDARSVLVECIFEPWEGCVEL